jgi:hypothetical protein
MVELKYTNTNKVRFSPHQILWAKQKSNRNFLLLEHAPPRGPSLIKLYESKSIEGLLLDHREVKPLAVNDWSLIQKILPARDRPRCDGPRLPHREPLVNVTYCRSS